MSKEQSSDSPGKIVPLPEHETLRAEIEKLRTELSMLVLERDELIFVECKNIEIAYMLSVGALEYKAYELECAVLRLNRKADLIQSRKNRQQKVILFDIEKAICWACIWRMSVHADCFQEVSAWSVITAMPYFVLMWNADFTDAIVGFLDRPFHNLTSNSVFVG